MSINSSIEWTDATWCPVRAKVRENAGRIAAERGYGSLVKIATKMQGHVGPHCESTSPGCKNCYSETNNGRCLPSNGTGLPFDRRSRDLVEIFLDEKMLMQPLHWKRPRKIFVNSQTDTFGEFVPDELIDRMFAVMALCPQHTFQVLTKRADRMREYMLSRAKSVRFWRAALPVGWTFDFEGISLLSFPLRNVWLGVSCEDQQRADERVPLLLQTPAVVRFVSAEPLLVGPVDLSSFMGHHVTHGACVRCGIYHPATLLDGCTYQNLDEPIDWVIVGGESGPGARPCDPAWIRFIVGQCKEAGAACFVKQLGAVPVGLKLKDRKGGDLLEWPGDLRVREMPREVAPQ